MTNFRACLGALAAGTLLLMVTQVAIAGKSTNLISGSQAEVDGSCVDPVLTAAGFNCVYDGGMFVVRLYGRKVFTLTAA
jgi:hypothetical protein